MHTLTSAGPIPWRTALLLTTGCSRGPLEACKCPVHILLVLSFPFPCAFLPPTNPLGRTTECFCFYFLVPTKLLCYVWESCNTDVSYSVTALVCSSPFIYSVPSDYQGKRWGARKKKET